MFYCVTSDVLSRILGEGDILSVYDGTARDVMPTRLIGVGVHVIRVIRVVGEQLETKHVSIVHQDMAGGDIDYQLIVLIVLLLVNKE